MTTTPIDFATILDHCRDTMRDAMEFPSYIDVDVLLAAEVPGTDRTIGGMLAEWGPLVALAGGYAHHRLICPLSKPYFMPAPACTCGLDAARAALEAVRRG